MHQTYQPFSFFEYRTILSKPKVIVFTCYIQVMNLAKAIMTNIHQVHYQMLPWRCLIQCRYYFQENDIWNTMLLTPYLQHACVLMYMFAALFRCQIFAEGHT